MVGANQQSVRSLRPSPAGWCSCRRNRQHAEAAASCRRASLSLSLSLSRYACPSLTLLMQAAGVVAGRDGPVPAPLNNAPLDPACHFMKREREREREREGGRERERSLRMCVFISGAQVVAQGLTWPTAEGRHWGRSFDDIFPAAPSQEASRSPAHEVRALHLSRSFYHTTLGSLCGAGAGGDGAGAAGGLCDACLHRAAAECTPH